MQPAFTRGFRLHHNGRTIHGAEFPDGEVIVADDPQHGLGTAALSLEELLKGYHGARVEWPGDQLVPTALFLELVSIAERVAVLDTGARDALHRLSKYIGYPDNVIAQHWIVLETALADTDADEEANRALERGDDHL